MVVPQDTKVAEVAIFIVDHRIEHQHTFDFLIGFRSQLFIILQAGFQPALPDDTPNGDVRCVNVCKQPAPGSQDALPVLQLVAHRVQAHGLGDLAGVKLTVWLISGIGRAGSASFVQVNSIPLDKPPALGQHPIGG